MPPTLHMGGGVAADWAPPPPKKKDRFSQTLMFYPIHLYIKENEQADNHGRPKQNRISFAGYLKDAYWYICVPPAT